ncbi:hypothetical protein Huta_2872 [Halorhabdus utahensis DSM 12940]|uniref:DUF7305 domain-containing protein n=1 Tax=Halorhabdus utahensis (strain DSM 12940 / JCM 11049 / AX-2) TaxID=519442 RepID=C7NRS8_HALUD|nr:hypothetical protein [Halorhabdus utahensis]ACV13033.1 hypothetical protein Huta_2872 [Halorhabdus utahensis DSM 12940]
MAAVKVETSPGKPSRLNYQQCIFVEIEFETATITEIYFLATIVIDIVSSKMGLSSDGSGESRGLSSVMGFALVFGMVIAGSMVIVSVGAVSLSESQSVVSMESAVTAMNDVDATISSIRGHSGSQASIKLPDDGEYVNSGWIQIEITDSSGTVQNQTGKITLGKYAYERDGQEVAYQGGGVWRGDGENFVMVSPPDFEYAGGPNPTLSFPITSLEGVNATGRSYSIAANRSNNISADTLPRGPIDPGNEVQITVHSKYADGWARYLNKRADGDVTKTGSKTVKLTLTSPKTPSVVSGPISSTGSVGMDPESGMDYYDSTVGPYSASQGDGGLPTAIARGSFDPRADGSGDTFNSHVLTTGKVDITGSGDLTFAGDLISSSDDDSKMRAAVTVNGDFSTEGSLELSSNKRKVFQGDFYVGDESGDNLDIGPGTVGVQGDLHVAGSITGQPSNLNVAGQVHVGGSSGSISKDSSSPDSPLDPGISSIQHNANLISQKNNELSNPTNDNTAESGDISAIENGGCSPCELEAGDYYVDEIDLTKNEKIILDTSDGPIQLFVNGPTDVKEANLTINGSNGAEIYSNGEVDIHKDSEVVTRNPRQSASSLTWYLPPSETFRIKASTFTGLVDAPNADLKMKSGSADPVIYGGMIGNFDSITKDAQFHFDNALRSGGGSGGSGSSGSGANEIDYLRVTNPTVEVQEE